MSRLVEVVLLSIVGFIIAVLGIVSSVLVIIEEIKNLSVPAITKLNRFKVQNIIARKEFLGQINRGNSCLSSFFMQINPFELRIPLKSLSDRILVAFIFLPLIIIIVILVNITIFNNFGIEYVPIVPLTYLIIFGIYPLEDDFTLFNYD